MMLSIFTTTDRIAAVQTLIAREERLGELVSVYDLAERVPSPDALSFVVDSCGITLPLDWRSTAPPYLLQSPQLFTDERLLALIFGRLGNLDNVMRYSAAYSPADSSSGENRLSLVDEFRIIACLASGELLELPDPVLPCDVVDTFERYRLLHNAAIIKHYGNTLEKQTIVATEYHNAASAAGNNADTPKETVVREVLFGIRQAYQEALLSAPDSEWRAFTAWHAATFFLDTGMLDEAESLLQENIASTLSDDAQYTLYSLLCAVWMKRLSIPYNMELVERIKSVLWKSLQYCECHAMNTEAALLLIDASEIANICGSYAESLGYINRAITLLETEFGSVDSNYNVVQGYPELLAQAQLRKATLLYTWAQHGNPQFYRGALEAFQRALKVFRQDYAPEVFADIHHKLGVIYSEMPDEAKKRQIWSALAASSFQEALKFFTKETHPYEYAMICNNYANAVIKFPTGLTLDANHERALMLYKEALSVRTRDMPYERAITLLNYLEACWTVGAQSDFAAGQSAWERYDDMLSKALEVKELVSDPLLLESADTMLTQLAELRHVLEQESVRSEESLCSAAQDIQTTQSLSSSSSLLSTQT